MASNNAAKHSRQKFASLPPSNREVCCPHTAEIENKTVVANAAHTRAVVKPRAFPCPEPHLRQKLTRKPRQSRWGGNSRIFPVTIVLKYVRPMLETAIPNPFRKSVYAHYVCSCVSCLHILAGRLAACGSAFGARS